MTCSLKSSKLRQPEPPASATVVTPTRKVNPSGKTLLSPAYESAFARAGVDVRVDVDQTRSDVETRNIHHFTGFGRIDLRSAPLQSCRPL